MEFKKLALASAIAATLVGCGADDQEYDSVERDSKEMAVKDLKTDGRWFYVPTTGAAPRFALNQFPFLQGMGRYVELCFTEDGLDVRHFDRNNPDLNIPKDSNGYCREQSMVGSDDLTNFAHVLTIPGDFESYRCAEDRYGDCTNKEETNGDANVPFTAKTHFTPDPESLSVSEFNYEDLYGLTDGLTEKDVTLISWDFDPKGGVLNFELERTFQVDIDKISNYINFGTKAGIEDALSDGAFKARFYYSLVHESILASKDYEPILYPVGDENDIGFFTTASKKLNPITNKYDREVVYLNRFNPEQGTIKYYLSDNFFEEKNKLFLDSTIETVKKMNLALNMFGSDSGKPEIEIVNASEAMGIHPGDLRYNIINLVDEPLANGLLGYGPSVANPMTGEIIKAHVNQYSGVARTGVPYYWDNLTRFYNRNQLQLNGLQPVDNTPAQIQTTTQEVTDRMSELSLLSAISKLEAKDVTAPYVDEAQVKQQSNAVRPTELIKNSDLNDDMDLEEIVKAEENRLAFWAENNAYPIEASWVSSSSKAMLENLKLDDERYFKVTKDDAGNVVKKELLRWKYLPKDLQQTAADAITVATYSNTLVHELGHNVGLRHNFKGSNDKANYYSHEQASALGLHNIPAYSSTMDYAPSMLDETPTWGLYDIAAFKFAYGRNVETLQDSPVTALAPVTLPTDREPTQKELDDYAAYQSYVNSFGYKYGAGDNNTSLMVCTGTNTPVTEAGKSLYNCDFSRFDAAARTNTEENYAKTRYGVLHYLDNVAEIERKDYAFCTDGNVSLNSDCNRFDEGTSLEEISTYKWQSYLDSYDRRNAAEYGVNGVYLSDYPSYIVRRFSEMNQIRDKMEDLERIDSIFADPNGKPGDYLNQLSLNPTYCNAGDANNYWFCDYAYGAQKSAAFFLDVLRTPEYQCVVQNADGNQKVISLGAALSSISYKIPADYDILEANCFDAVTADAIETDFDTKGYTAVAETASGRFLTSVGSFDPDFPWSNAVSILGNWPDKALASHFLARRFSNRYTDEVSFASMLDIPGVKAEYDAIMANLLVQTPLATPIKLVDATGAEFTSLNGVSVNLHKTTKMESLNVLPRGIANFFDISYKSRDRIADVILKTGLRQMRSEDYLVESRGQAQFDSLTKQQDYFGLISGEKVKFSIGGKEYVATKANTLAYEYATKMTTTDGYALKVHFDNYTKSDLQAIADSMTKAWGTVVPGWKPEYQQPVNLLDSTFVNAFATFIAAEIAVNPPTSTWGEAVVPAFDKFVNQEITAGNLVNDKDAKTFVYKGGKTHLETTIYSSFFSTYQLTFWDSAPTLLAAVDAVHAGYTAASTADKEVWLAGTKLTNAYLDGDYAAVAGEYYRLLDQLPTAADLY